MAQLFGMAGSIIRAFVLVVRGLAINVVEVELGPSGDIERPNAVVPLMRAEPGRREAVAVDSHGDQQSVKGLSPLPEVDAWPPDPVEEGANTGVVLGEFFPGLGLESPSDLANKGMDMMTGTTGIIDSDYPFVCLCNQQGQCDGDVQETACTARAGQMSTARHSGTVLGVLVSVSFQA